MTTHPFRLDGRRALVTGASRGIGRAIAASLAAAGASLVVHGRDEAALDTVRAEIAATGGEVSALTGELTDRDAARRLCRECAAGGAIDILVNNAGINIRNGLFDASESDWDQVLELDLTSCFILCQEIARGMTQRRWGRIINIASIMSVVARAGIPAYATAKHGLVGLTRALAAELGPSGVTVNAIGPGFIRTEATQVHAGGFSEMVIRRTPVGRWGEPADIGGSAVFLASDAAGYVNGHLLVIDGGFTVTM